MSKSTIHLPASIVYSASWAHWLLFGPIGWTVWVVALAPFGKTSFHAANMDAILQALMVFLPPLAFASLFLRHLSRNAQPVNNKDNLAEWLTADIARQLSILKAPTVSDLLTAAIRSRRGIFILHEIGVEPKEVLSCVSTSIDGIDPVTLLTQARSLVSARPDDPRIGGNVLLPLGFTLLPSMREILNRYDVSIDDVGRIVEFERFHERTHLHTTFSAAMIVKHFGSMGRSWVTGYTDDLDRVTTNMGETEEWTDKKEPQLHADILDAIFRMIAKDGGRNILLTGNAGVGKATIIENLARRLHEYELKTSIPYTRVLVLKIEQLLSGAQKPDTFLLHALSRANENGRFILAIENLPMLLKAASVPLKEVLIQFLQTKNINIIAIADTQDYHTTVKAETSIDMQFEKMQVGDASAEQTLLVLAGASFAIERSKSIHVTYKAITSVYELTERFVSRGGMPGKAIDVLNESVSVARNAGARFVTDDHVRKAVSQKANMSVERLDDAEKRKLIHLEKALTEHIVGQKDVITAIVRTLKRARLDIASGKRPLGTFLFLGPTGVGKTETAKALATEYFGSPQNMIRLDLNEYSQASDVADIAGSSQSGIFREGFLTRRVQDKPFSLILLDEIEKAHPSVLNIFLQILDEGFLIDGRGVRTDFRNTIIIATSNAGALFLQDLLRQHGTGADTRKALIESIVKEGIFLPEFINRFDEIILFLPLTAAECRQIAILMLGQIIKEFSEKRGIHLVIETPIIDMLAERGYSPEFGAREMRRKIREIVESYIADEMLRKEYKRGDTMTIRQVDLGK